MAARKDLAKIGSEGFALIEEYYGRPRRRPAAPGQPQPMAVAQPPRRTVEPSPPIRCDQLAKAHGGMVIKEWGTGKRVNKAH